MDKINYTPEFIIALLKINIEKQLELIQELEVKGERSNG